MLKPRGALLALFLLLGCLTTAAAQQTVDDAADATSTAELSVDELRSRLAQLRSEIEQENAAAAQRELIRNEELVELAAQRRGVAEQALALQLEHERNLARTKELSVEVDRASKDAAEFRQNANSIADILKSAVDQLQIHLNELPATDQLRDEVRSAASALSWTPESEPSQQTISAVETILSAVDQTHADALAIAVRPESIRTATGRREDVKLLHVGHARFAYETVEDGRIGLALASPRDVTGYRWSEDLTSEQQTSIREAIAAIEADRAAITRIALDPTGRLQPEAMAASPGLWDWFKTGGLVMIPIGAVALASVLLILERSYVYFVQNPASEELATSVFAAVRDGDQAHAAQLCARTRGAVPRVLAACLSRSSSGQRAMEDSIQEQLLHELPRLQRFMGGIATLGAVAPLLGLLGTVTGIINTFEAIRSFGNANPSLMAGGISEALITTAAGLMIAIPVLVTHSLLRGRSDRILADSERYAANLLTLLSHGPHAAADAQRQNGAASGEAVEAETVESGQQWKH